MQISDAESQVMEILWKRAPLSSDDVVQALSRTHAWAEPTIKTLLGRLMKKGAITATREGRRYLYSPVLKRETWIARESESVLKRLFDGRVAPLVAHFSKAQKLSEKDIAELRKLIDEIDP